MYFSLIDRITALDASRIVAVKQLQPSETYLRDHFPGFPVMPGVLMIEAAYQACSWLLLFADQFKTDIARLHDVRNVKFGSFVQPGDTLTLTAEILQRDELKTTLQFHGAVRDQTAFTGRLTLECSPPVATPGHEPEQNDTRRNELEASFHQLCDPVWLTDKIGAEVA